MNETELMQRVAVGEPMAVAQILRDHYEAVFRVMRQLSRSREDAEDLTQEVFLTARAKGQSFKGGSTVRTWLIRVGINAFRKQTRRRRVLAAVRLDRPRNVDRLEAMIDGEWLLAGLAQLSDDHRIALLLHEVHGFSVAEVAEITRAPVGTVKARLHYARKRLQQILTCPEETNGE